MSFYGGQAIGCWPSIPSIAFVWGAMNPNHEKIVHLIAQMLDHPSVFMGGPSHGNKLNAERILKGLERSGFEIVEAMERIEASAVHPRGGEPTSLPAPARHHDVIAYLAKRGFGPGDMGPARQGFMTTKGRFVDRVEAFDIAKRAGQLLRKGQPGGRLYSEDLW